ncbi:hypothetical protein BGZ73_002950 [Actinomortierella ambigua]|nr:hypothetical protein BGZ73_002950 [Actinomortierella ambigua]
MASRVLLSSTARAGRTRVSTAAPLLSQRIARPVAGYLKAMPAPRPGMLATMISSFHSTSQKLSSTSVPESASLMKTPPKITAENIVIGGQTYATDEFTNVTPTILEKTTRQLHLIPTHPIAIIKERIASSFPGFKHYDQFSPVVTTKQNFDDLCFAEDHPGRSPTDTYYLNKKIMLRTHTSAHQSQTLAEADRLLVTADVYRRDEIDASHYPVFHQMEGAEIFDVKTIVQDVRKVLEAAGSKMSTPSSVAAAAPEAGVGEQGGADKAVSAAAANGGSGIHTTDTTVITAENPKQDCHSEEVMLAAADHLKHSLNQMVRNLFSHEEELQVRWIDAYFPFTSPSWEMEIYYQGQWLEVLGCGVIRQDILDTAGKPDKVGWAFGLGLERLAMVLFGIPDIRLFWSKDERFLQQFQPGQIQKFKAFSKYPPCIKDISFWTVPGFHENNLCEVVRDLAGDVVEDVRLIDEFTHPKTKRHSVCYRINYRSMDRNVTNAEINEIQERLRTAVSFSKAM